MPASSHRRLFFWRKREQPPPPVTDERTLTDDLRDYLFAVLSCMSPEQRKNAHWVMSAEWELECRKLMDWAPSIYAPLPPLSAPQLLFGKPIVVREGGGAPYLEAW